MSEHWTTHVPALFRALASPDERATLPRPVTGGFEYACATWGALHYALSSLLGWRDVGAGLAWWYRAGKPTTDSPVLELVKEVWGRGDLIDYYAAWTWKPPGSGWRYSQEHSSSDGPSPTWLGANSILWPDEDWWRMFVRRGTELHHDPFYGGDDALHLSMHHGPSATQPSGEALLATTSRPRHAVLIVGGIDHWLADLEANSTRLPPAGDRSWRVEVFDRKVGYLGMFRRSRVTGRWFTGKHSVHERGNP